jgi:hypothetical protein
MRPNRRGTARNHVAIALAVAVAVPSISAGVASAQIGAGGGTTAPGDPQVTSIQCVTRCIGPSTGVVKSKIRLLGTDLAGVTVVSMARADGSRANALYVLHVQFVDRIEPANKWMNAVTVSVVQ